MFRAANALEQGGNGASRAELANEIDRTDIDAQFEWGSGDEALSSPRFSRFSASSRSFVERLP